MNNSLFVGPKFMTRKLEKQIRNRKNPSFHSTPNLLAPRDDYYMPKVRLYIYLYNHDIIIQI
jgi:hypothetical protein